MVRFNMSLGTLNCKLSGLACCLLASLILPGCQHTRTISKSKGPSTMESRMLHPDMKKGNPFDKEFNTASAGDRGGTKSLGAKGFHTSKATGFKDYGGAGKSFHTGDFAQAGKQSHMGKESSAFGSQKNRMGGQTFATKDSKFSGMAAKQNSKSYRDSNSVYQTSDFGPAKKSFEDNNRVVLERGERDANKNANAYSEDDVKRLLNR